MHNNSVWGLENDQMKKCSRFLRLRLCALSHPTRRIIKALQLLRQRHRGSAGAVWGSEAWWDGEALLLPLGAGAALELSGSGSGRTRLRPPGARRHPGCPQELTGVERVWIRGAASVCVCSTLCCPLQKQRKLVTVCAFPGQGLLFPD